MIVNYLNTLNYKDVKIITIDEKEYFITRDLCTLLHYGQTGQIINKLNKKYHTTLTHEQSISLGVKTKRGLSVVSRRGVQRLIENSPRMKNNLALSVETSNYLELFEDIKVEQEDTSPKEIKPKEIKPKIVPQKKEKKVKDKKSIPIIEETIKPLDNKPKDKQLLEIDISDPLSFISSLKDLFTKMESMIIENEELKEKLKVYNQITHSENSITFNTFVSILKQNGLDIDRQSFNTYLKENGYLLGGTLNNNLPTDLAMDLGLFEISQDTIGSVKTGFILLTPTYITTYGQEFFLKQLLP